MKFSRGARYAVFIKYNGHCAYCGEALNLSAFQIDHIQAFPVDHSFLNLNPSCRKCNIFKSNLSIDDFRSKIQIVFHTLNYFSGTISILKRFGLVVFHSGPVVFYFEKADQNRQSNGMELKK